MRSSFGGRSTRRQPFNELQLKDTGSTHSNFKKLIQHPLPSTSTTTMILMLEVVFFLYLPIRQLILTDITVVDDYATLRHQAKNQSLLRPNLAQGDNNI